MPKPKGANRTLYAATHAHILDAATALFAARGFAAVTTPEVAAGGALQEARLIRQDSVRALTVLLFGALDQAAFEIADFPDDRDLRRQLVDGFAALLERLRT